MSLPTNLPTLLPLITLLLSLTLFFLLIIHPLLLSPHSHIPGPRLCALTPYYLSYLDLSLRRNRTILAWHRRYGPVVRIRPAEVSLADPADFRAVYAGKARYDKGDYFRLFAHRGRDCLFSTTAYAEHQARRRRVAGAFTVTAVRRDADGFVRERVRRVMERVGDAESGSGTVDFFHLWACLSLDVVTRFLYGVPHGTCSIEEGEGGKLQRLVGRKQRAQVWGMLWMTLPWFHGSWVARMLLPKDYGEALRTAVEVEAFAEEMMGKQDGDGARDGYASVYKVLRDSQGKMDKIDRDTVASELFDDLTAGQDTTASYLTSLSWRLARHKDWQGRLRHEVNALELEEDGLPSYADVDGCSVLDAIMRETFRVHPVSSGRTERVVPKGGRSYSGVFVPEGTVVVGQLLAMHRNGAVFPDSDSWKPARWLEASKEELAEMDKSYVPFGYGGRICIGRHLAILQVKTAISMLIRSFDISPAATCSDDSMETLDTLAAVPKALRCDLVSKRIQHSNAGGKIATATDESLLDLR